MKDGEELNKIYYLNNDDFVGILSVAKWIKRKNKNKILKLLCISHYVTVIASQDTHPVEKVLPKTISKANG